MSHTFYPDAAINKTANSIILFNFSGTCHVTNVATQMIYEKIVT